jgi:hypothetical protein
MAGVSKLNAIERSYGFPGGIEASCSGWREVNGIVPGRLPQLARRRKGVQNGTTKTIFLELGFHGEAPLHQEWRCQTNRFPPDVVVMVSDA